MASQAQAQSIILYSRHDAAQAARVERLARTWGTVDIDTMTQPGVLWRVDIAQRICSAALVFVVWSERAAASIEVGEEWRIALACGRWVVPVLLDDAAMPGELGARQGVDWRELTRNP